MKCERMRASTVRSRVWHRCRGRFGRHPAGTRTQYVQYAGPGDKPPFAFGTYPMREAGARSPYVPNGGPGAYASAQPATVPVDTLEDLLRRGALHAVLRHLDDLARDRLRSAVRLGLGLGSGYRLECH